MFNPFPWPFFLFIWTKQNKKTNLINKIVSIKRLCFVFNIRQEPPRNMHGNGFYYMRHYDRQRLFCSNKLVLYAVRLYRLNWKRLNVCVVTRFWFLIRLTIPVCLCYCSVFFFFYLLSSFSFILYTQLDSWTFIFRVLFIFLFFEKFSVVRRVWGNKNRKRVRIWEFVFVLIFSFMFVWN